MNLGFFKLQPEIAHHGTGWEDEGVKARLSDTNKDNKLHGAIYCIPARTYKAKHDPICCAASVEKWLKMLTDEFYSTVGSLLVNNAKGGC